MAIKLETKNLNLFYGEFQALKNVSIQIQEKRVTAMIGPSGCGKSTLLRVFNRMNDTIHGVKVRGETLLDGRDIYGLGVQLTDLRRRVGMVFQKPNPFPLSIYQNVAYGPQIHGLARPADLDRVVERSLSQTNLWPEVKDGLDRSALSLSAEQQQRLCIARALAVEPEVLLMDEPCSALDPVATGHIEELIAELKQSYTIVIVTHNMQQAARVSDEAGYMLLGELVEVGPTAGMFTTPKDSRTEDYITGRFG